MKILPRIAEIPVVKMIVCASALVAAGFGQPTSTESSSQPTLETRFDEFAWSGELGYSPIKMVLRGAVQGSDGATHELVIFDMARASKQVIRGTLVPIPTKVKTEPHVSFFFVRPERQPDERIAAALLADGSLLYYFPDARSSLGPTHLNPLR